MGAVEETLLLLLLLLLLGGAAPLLGSSSSPRHTLRYFETAFWEPGWRLPRFTSLAYVDDQLIGRFDRDADQCVPQSLWIEEIGRDDSDFWARHTEWDFASGLVMDLMILKSLYNQSRGIHTLQAHSGCELTKDHRATRWFAKYGYNGRDFLSLDVATLTWTAMDTEAKPIKRKWEAEQYRGKLWGDFQTTCVDGLRTHLRYGREELLRIDPPMMRMTHKAGSNGLETLTCRAHGFYPKEIAMSWKRDGVDQMPDASAGGVVPNADKTYHAWLSIEVDPEDWGHFQCHVEHNGLPKPLDLVWEEPASVFTVGLIVGVILGCVAALALVGAGVIIFHTRKPQEGSYKGVQERPFSLPSVSHPAPPRPSPGSPAGHPDPVALPLLGVNLDAEPGVASPVPVGDETPPSRSSASGPSRPSTTLHQSAWDRSRGPSRDQGLQAV